MNTFKDEIKNKIIEKIANVGVSDAPASLETVQAAQKKLGCVFGAMLKNYLTEFGYLSFGYFEMYGINERQKLNSDMVKSTEMLHEAFSVTRGKVAIENLGDGYYILCDNQDMVYEFIPDENSQALNPLGKNLLTYIIQHSQD